LKSRRCLAASAHAPAHCRAAKMSWPPPLPQEKEEEGAGKAAAAATAMEGGEEAAELRRHWVAGTWSAERGSDAPAAANEPCGLGMKS
jgi:hypothetical protein